MDRIKRLFEYLKDKKLDGVVLSKQPTMFYFTGFSGDESFAIIKPSGKPIILTDARYTLWAKEEAKNAIIYTRKGTMTELLEKVINKHHLNHIGFVGEEVSVAELKKLRAKIKKTKWTEIKKDNILSLRAIKDEREIRQIKRAIKIAEESFIELLGKIRPDWSERKTANELEYIMKSKGAERVAFDIIVSAGKNSAKPHAKVGETKLGKGRPIIIDFGAVAGGYCCDLTRTIWIGKMSKNFEKMYKVCLEVQLKAIDKVKAGTKCSDIDKSVRRTIGSFGFGKFIAHSAGHGFGLEVHEKPILSIKTDNRETLESNQTITIEPGIYIPNIGGIRIEDNMIVKKNRAEVISNLPKEIKSIVI